MEVPKLARDTIAGGSPTPSRSVLNTTGSSPPPRGRESAAVNGLAVADGDDVFHGEIQSRSVRVLCCVHFIGIGRPSLKTGRAGEFRGQLFSANDSLWRATNCDRCRGWQLGVPPGGSG